MAPVVERHLVLVTLFLDIPNMEAVAGDAIRAAGYNAYPSVPAKNPQYPLAVVQRLGGLPPERHKLDGARIQVDAWGDNKQDAFTLAQKARTALMNLEGTKSPKHQVYVTGVEDEVGPMWLPDPDTGRDRYVFAVMLYGYTLGS